MFLIECFGAASIRDDSGTPRLLRSRKHLGLLIYVATSPNTLHSRDGLAALLWTGPNQRARHSLSQAVYDIRSSLGPVLAVTPQSLSLCNDKLAFEGAMFEQAVTAAAGGRALAIYRGPFCPNLTRLGVPRFDRWIEQESDRYKALALLSIGTVQREAEERGDWDRMCLAALRLIRLNDLDEDAHTALMRGLWMKGDPASALTHASALLGRAASKDWPRVRELARRIEDSGAASEVLTVPRSPLRLVGRGDEFRQLFGAAQCPPANGSVTIITGERGIGKSALLMKLARRLEVGGRDVKWISHRPGCGATIQGTRPDGNAGKPTAVFVDCHPGSDSDLPQLLNALRKTRTLVFVAVAAPTAKGLTSCEGVTVVQLGPLSKDDIVRLASQRHPALRGSIVRACAGLSGGNPELALVLCRAVSGSEGFNEGMRPGEIAVELLARESAATRLIGEWFEEVPEPELELASFLAHACDASLAVLEEHLTTAENLALEGLRRRGWVARGGALRLLHPILLYALRMRASGEVVRRFQRSIGERLANGTLVDQHAAALEFERAGLRVRARVISRGVADAALAAGNPVVAAAAGEVAYRVSVDTRERFEVGLLWADAALTRGSVARAAAVLRRLELLAPSPEAAFEVAVKLGKAAIAQGTVDEAARTLAVKEPIDCDGDGDGSVRVRRAALELAHLRLAFAYLKGEPKQDKLASALERELLRSRRRASSFASTWADAVRLLFSFNVVSRSRADARRVLASHMKTLSGIGDVGRSLITTCLAVLELKAARICEAERLLREVVDGRSMIEDRIHALALNNLAVALLESGRFEEASRELERTVVIDRSVGLPVREHVTALMNQAQCAFFADEGNLAWDRCQRVARLAQYHALPAMEAQAIAMSGLLALWRGQRNAAEERARHAEELRPALPHDSDSYLVEWFLSALGEQRRAGAGRERLRAAALDYDTLDRLSAAKLRVLAASVKYGSVRDDPAARPAVQRLSAGGCSWFVSFAERRQGYMMK